MAKFRLASGGSTNATLVSAKPVTIKKIIVSNSNAAARYLKLYDAVAAPTVGTTAVALSILVPPVTTVVIDERDGNPFVNGLALAAVTGVADSDTAAVAANDLLIHIRYE